jgi:hypothetical protein
MSTHNDDATVFATDWRYYEALDFLERDIVRYWRGVLEKGSAGAFVEHILGQLKGEEHVHPLLSAADRLLQTISYFGDDGMRHLVLRALLWVLGERYEWLQWVVEDTENDGAVTMPSGPTGPVEYGAPMAVVEDGVVTGIHLGGRPCPPVVRQQPHGAAVAPFFRPALQSCHRVLWSSLCHLERTWDRLPRAAMTRHTSLLSRCGGRWTVGDDALIRFAALGEFDRLRHAPHRVNMILVSQLIERKQYEVMCWAYDRAKLIYSGRLSTDEEVRQIARVPGGADWMFRKFGNGYKA